MGSAEISKNKTRISRYFGDLAKSLWQPLNIDVDMIFISAIFLIFLIFLRVLLILKNIASRLRNIQADAKKCVYHKKRRVERLKFSELAQFKVKFRFIYIIFSGGCQKSIHIYMCKYNFKQPFP